MNNRSEVEAKALDQCIAGFLEAVPEGAAGADLVYSASVVVAQVAYGLVGFVATEEVINDIAENAKALIRQNRAQGIVQ